MDIDAKKIAFVEEFLKVEDLSIIEMLSSNLRNATLEREEGSIDKFAGVLNDSDTKDFKDAYQECRKIDLNEW